MVVVIELDGVEWVGARGEMGGHCVWRRVVEVFYNLEKFGIWNVEWAHGKFGGM